jgi:hypothetical protein
MIPSLALERAKPNVTGLTCGGCGAKYVDEAWSALVLSQRIEPLEVQSRLLEWPDDLCIEVRACVSCGALMARKRGGRHPPVGTRDVPDPGHAETDARR